MSASTSSGGLRQMPSRAYLLYRRSHIGIALLNALDTFLATEDSFTLSMAYKILQTFDHANAKLISDTRLAIKEPPKVFEFVAKQLVAVRVVDGLHWILLKDVVVRRCFHATQVNEFMEIEKEKRSLREKGRLRGNGCDGGSATKGRSKAGAAKVQKQETVVITVQRVKYLAICCFNPFTNAKTGKVKLDDWWFKVNQCAQNVNPRLELVTYLPVRKSSQN